MNNITDSIKSRRSVRTFDGREISAEEKEAILTFSKTIENPYKISVEFKLMSAKEKGLSCPVVSGTDLYIGGKIKKALNANEAFGYSFERLVLYAQSLGIVTVWLGGTMNRSAYETAMELSSEEMMPCASPLGYPADKMSFKESMMRKAIKANERLDFEELFFNGDFATPLKKEKAGVLVHPLEMVRLSPSAVNKQPWRVVITHNTAHFYLKRSKGFTPAQIDMQKIDIGIALCHFDLAAKESGLNVTFTVNDPKIENSINAEYIASYIIEE